MSKGFTLTASCLQCTAPRLLSALPPDLDAGKAFECIYCKRANPLDWTRLQIKAAGFEHTGHNFDEKG